MVTMSMHGGRSGGEQGLKLKPKLCKFNPELHITSFRAQAPKELINELQTLGCVGQCLPEVQCLRLQSRVSDSGVEGYKIWVCCDAGLVLKSFWRISALQSPILTTS